MVLNQPRAIAVAIDEGVARLNLLTIAELKAVGACIHGFVATQLNRAALDLPYGPLGQESHEVVVDTPVVLTWLRRQRGQQQGLVAVERRHLVRVTALQGAVPAIKEVFHLGGADRGTVDSGFGVGRCWEHQHQRQGKSDQKSADPA